MPLIFLAMLVVPIVEIYLMLQVSREIGVVETVLLLVGISLLGAWLIRREGPRVWAAFTAAIGSGRVPAREVADGALVMFGGALLLTPGFFTDALGVLCLLPPTRAILRRPLLAYVVRRATGGGFMAPMMRVRSQRQGTHTRPGQEHPVIDGDLQPRSEPPRT